MNNDQLLNQLTSQAVEARRLMLGRLIFNGLGGTVGYGPLRGFRLNEQQAWGQGDLGPKLLGLYEQEILELITAKNKVWDSVINLGAGDGYYGVGLVASGVAKRSICFEQSEEGQAAIRISAEINKVADRITILGRAEQNFLDQPEVQAIDLGRTLVIVDIEGGEFGLLTPDILNRLAGGEMIVELHGGFFPKEPDLEPRFVKHLQSYFACSSLPMGRRDLSQIREIAGLGDSDRWLLCSEGRPFLMRWVHCTPKQKAA
jgi:predicted enzyme related to lactoylglutathione lyase